MTADELRKLPAGTPLVYREGPATLIDVGVSALPGGGTVDIVRVHSPRYGVRVGFVHEVSGRATAPATTRGPR